MLQKSTLLLAGVLTISGCTPARLSHDEVRKKIAEIGQSTLTPSAVEVQRIVSQTDNRMIAEGNVTLAFQFARDNPNAAWRVEAVRLGDRQWIDLNELVRAINEGRARTTLQSMRKLADGIAQYRTRNASLPPARDIVTLTDLLFPQYMSELIRVDGWGNEIEYALTPTGFTLISKGPNGVRGGEDDVVISSAQTGAAATP